MEEIRFDFTSPCGCIKPMNAVNNGPVNARADQIKSNFNAYRQARIPYARTHDSAHYWRHTVDITCVFPDFSADPSDPASYDFWLTDEYLCNIAAAGTEVFFRLGQSIEHESKKYGTIPPADFRKWAVICEHVVRHYTEGWGNGKQMKIRYWEIWNEPDLDTDDSANKRTWGGTKAQFFDFFETAAKHLKACFPQLKIGGPAVASVKVWTEEFLAEMQRRHVPLDFFSWHRYSSDPETMQEKALSVRRLLDQYGYQNAESILNEWNYVKNWTDQWVYSIRCMGGLKGASFATAVMSLCQYSPVDMLMYYDARPSAMNGLFDFYTLEKRKSYYPFYAFSKLSDLGTAAAVKRAEDSSVYGVAAMGRDRYGILVTYYRDSDNICSREVELHFDLPQTGSVYCAEYYLLDHQHDLTFVRSKKFHSSSFCTLTNLNLFDVYYISIKCMSENSL